MLIATNGITFLILHCWPSEKFSKLSGSLAMLSLAVKVPFNYFGLMNVGSLIWFF